MVRTCGEKDRSSKENMADGCDRTPKDGEIKSEVELCLTKIHDGEMFVCLCVSVFPR